MMGRGGSYFCLLRVDIKTEKAPGVGEGKELIAILET